MPRKQRHFVYDLYLAISGANGRYGLNLTERDGRMKIKALIPQFSGMVDAIIDAEGDLSKIPADLLERSDSYMAEEDNGTRNEDMNRKVREAANRSTLPSGQPDLNAMLREGRHTLPADAPADGFNRALRKAAGVA